MILEEGLRADDDLKQLILCIAGVTKEISASFFENDRGEAGTSNVYGEDQMKMDVWADGRVIEALKATGVVACIGSEEQPDEIKTGQGRYSVGVDPLDGSGNLGTGLLLGSIFGIYEGDSLVRPGREMKAALYVLYGHVTTLVITTGDGVDEYTLHKGNYVLRQRGLTIPDGKTVIPNSTRDKWTEEYNGFLKRVTETGVRIRNMGCMVADFHYILKKGGLYTYPGLTDKPGGKIRLVFESNPMTFIAQQAGGAGTSGKENILDIAPGSVQERCPVYVGSKNLVAMAEEAFK